MCIYFVSMNFNNLFKNSHIGVMLPLLFLLYTLESDKSLFPLFFILLVHCSFMLLEKIQNYFIRSK